MKVLIVTNMYPTEDRPVFGIFVQEQVTSIRKFYPDVQYDIYYIEGGGVKGASKWLSLKNYLKSIYEIDKILRTGMYDLVHVHYGFSGMFLFNPFRKKIPVLVTLHGGDIQPEQKKQFQVFSTRRILKRANMAITLNDRMDAIAKLYIRNTEMIPCSVDTDLFTPINNLNKGFKVNIVFPSNPSRFVKNYPLFKRTIEILRIRYGVDCETAEVDNMSREQVRDLFNKSHLLLMTSISEGSPQVVKEAMSCNLPVVSTPVGDVRWLLEGVAGCAIAKEHDAEELAALCADSLNGKINGMTPREKIFSLGLDAQHVASRIYSVYKKYALILNTK